MAGDDVPDDLAALVHLLELRPDVLDPPLPQDLDDLFERLDDPYAVIDAMQLAPLPVFEYAQALAGLAGVAAPAEVAALLGADEATAGHAASWLRDRFLTRPDGPHSVMSPGLLAVLADPLQLGPPAAELLATQPTETLDRALRFLGRDGPGRTPDALAALLAVLRDPVQVRSIVDSAPAAVRDALLAEAAVTDQPGPCNHAALAWAAERLLASRHHWGGYRLVREVTLALRGPDFHAPFTPHAPEPAAVDVDPDAVRRGTASAATAFLADATTVVDRLVTHPPALLKSGGVGTRELGKLAKATRVDESTVRLVLELLDARDLLDPAGSTLSGTGALGPWRQADPARRFADLLTAWWVIGSAPTEDRIDGKVSPAVARLGDCAGCTSARHALLAAVASADGAVSLADAGDLARWLRPLSHPDHLAEGEVAFSGTWFEAARLGVLADVGSRSALTVLGRALLDGDEGALLAAATELLPPAAEHALFGTDLTAVVPGVPGVSLSTLLDGCADRESGGGAVTWRFSPGSVRRALDGGTTGPKLLARLRDVARDGLPQPLEYLISDVARGHGALRVREATSVVRSDDTALLAQAAADRSLRALGLELLAPTVLTSTAAADQVLSVLRGAGYLPMPDGATPDVDPPTPGRVSSPPERPSDDVEPEVDLVAIAEQLLASTVDEPLEPTELTVRREAPGLSPSHARLLAAAVDAGTAVHITYRSSAGQVSERTVSDLDLVDTEIIGFCHLRQDEQAFSLRELLAVYPVPR